MPSAFGRIAAPLLAAPTLPHSPPLLPSPAAAATRLSAAAC
uniref:Uncharacterized protein n=1 Tax=Arundo donax TaxID=35708 RepID=A0A0A9EAX6_ARUDO